VLARHLRSTRAVVEISSQLPDLVRLEIGERVLGMEQHVHSRDDVDRLHVPPVVDFDFVRVPLVTLPGSCMLQGLSGHSLRWWEETY